MMEIRRITAESADIGRIEEMYDEAFPEAERIPFYMVRRGINDYRILNGYYDEEELIGMSFVILDDEDVAFLSYFCVREDLKGKGYGTLILRSVMERYPERIIVADIERPLDGSWNNEERLRRKDFYLRNGFTACNVYYSYDHVDYEIMAHNGIVDDARWNRTRRQLFKLIAGS